MTFENFEMTVENQNSEQLPVTCSRRGKNRVIGFRFGFGFASH